MDDMEFQIQGKDYEFLKKFHKNHKKCGKGMAFDQFSYTFSPTSLGIAITVKCSCGKRLLLGDFLDSSNEYHEVEDETGDENLFESAAIRILFLKDPRSFSFGFHKEQDFETIYTYAVGVAAYADKRIGRCILWKMNRDEETGALTENYRGTDAENMALFFEHFERRVREEISKYDSRNERLKTMLNLM